MSVHTRDVVVIDRLDLFYRQTGREGLNKLTGPWHALEKTVFPIVRNMNVNYEY